jgi:hypothetical protein
MTRLEALALFILIPRTNIILGGKNENKSHLKFIVMHLSTDFNLRSKLSIKMIKKIQYFPSIIKLPFVLYVFPANFPSLRYYVVKRKL